MKVYKWLNSPFSGILAHAVVEVEPNEVADIDSMAVLLDGSDVSHFGYKAELLSTGIPPRIKLMKDGRLEADSTLRWTRINDDRSRTRYYKVMVNRD